MNFLINLYALLFGRPFLRRFNYFFLKLGMRGLGFLNYENFNISGERFFLYNKLKKFEVNTIFDVGANIGNYSLLLSKSFNYSKIFCFEPHPLNFNKLRNNVQNINNITCFNFGFSDISSETLLFDYKNRGGSSHATLYDEVITDIIQSPVESINVEMQTIDNFLSDHSEINKICYLKIDTEGNELKVLKGAKDAINNDKIDIIQFEFGINNIISKVHLKDFITILENYNLYRILPKGLLRITYHMQYVDEILAFQNIVAINKKIDV